MLYFPRIAVRDICHILRVKLPFCLKAKQAQQKDCAQAPAAENFRRFPLLKPFVDRIPPEKIYLEPPEPPLRLFPRAGNKFPGQRVQMRLVLYQLLQHRKLLRPARANGFTALQRRKKCHIHFSGSAGVRTKCSGKCSGSRAAPRRRQLPRERLRLNILHFLVSCRKDRLKALLLIF